MRPPSSLVFALLLLGGCAAPKSLVWVDTDQVLHSSQPPAAPSPSLPKPPGPTPAEVFTMAGRPAEVLTGRGAATINRTVAASEGSEEEALRALQRRLEAIYTRQATYFEAEQRQLLGDPEKEEFEKIRPQLLAAFARYGEARMPIVLKLVSLVGFPDPNPKNLAPPESLKPVPLQKWKQANDLRNQLAKLDAGYSEQATALLAESAHLADLQRLTLLQKVDEFRKRMMDRAQQEAANPLRKSLTSVELTIGGDAPIHVPATPPAVVTMPALPAMEPAPKVEFEEDLSSESARKQQIRRELDIWLGIHNLALAPSKKAGVPDRTSEFSNWRRQQRLGL